MKITNFTEIDSWIEARHLVKSIYLLTSKNNFSKDYGLKDQIQRASVSTVDPVKHSLIF